MAEASIAGMTRGSFLDGAGPRWEVTGPSLSPGYTDVVRGDGLRSCRVTAQLGQALGLVALTVRRQRVATKTKNPPTDVSESGWARGDRVKLDGRVGRVTVFVRGRSTPALTAARPGSRPRAGSASPTSSPHSDGRGRRARRSHVGYLR